MFVKTGDPKLDEIPTHIVWSLFALLFCILPGGFAVYYSMRVIDDKKKGDAFEAREHARSAKIFVIISYACGVIVLIYQILSRYI